MADERAAPHSISIWESPSHVWNWSLAILEWGEKPVLTGKADSAEEAHSLACIALFWFWAPADEDGD
jgi:hypothetical protein